MPLCTLSQLYCIENITVDHSKCLKQCSGLVVSSYNKYEIEKNADLINFVDFNTVLIEYLKSVLGRWHNFPEKLEGFCIRLH